MKNIGIFGGSFNPVQIAHLIIAERFAEECQLDKCMFVPANLSPFKIDQKDKIITSEHRLNMLALALPGNDKFEIDDCEIQRGGISNTIDTVRYFENRFPESEVFMLIGSDHAKVFTKWKDWQSILDLVQLCIARRPYTISESDRSDIESTLSVRSKVIWIDIPLLDVSSSEIRSRIKQDRSINYIVPDKVIDYIRQNNLFID
jgi:nicotinate-nucleotide adenylyltransferase